MLSVTGHLNVRFNGCVQNHQISIITQLESVLLLLDYTSNMNELSTLLELKYGPVAIYRAPTVPSDASVPIGEHCCLPPLLLKAMRTGKKCAVAKADLHCHGALSGLGFGGIDNREHTAWSDSTVPPEKQAELHHMSDGKHEFLNPSIAMTQLEEVKDYGDGRDAIVFEPVEAAEAHGAPIEVVVFLADPTRISALFTLAGFDRTGAGPAARFAYGLGCQQIYAIPRREGESADPHAIVGMTDLYARRFIGKDQFSFAVPYSLYRRMQDNADRSFLAGERWQETLEKCI